MKSYITSRRAFLGSVGAAAGLVSMLDRLAAQEEGGAPVRRLLTVQRPVGTIPENWWPTGSGTDLNSFTLSRILQPFAPIRDRMVVFRGLGLPYEGSSGGGHERGTVLTVTGRRAPNLYPGNGGDDPYAEGASVDQLLLQGSSVLQDVPIQSLQLSCDRRADTPGEVSPRHMSYSAARAPMTPYYQPLDAYERVFGSIMPGGPSDENLEALARARAAKKSVLDFALRDLARMRTLAPSEQRVKLDAYEAAIRELEDELDAVPSDPETCGVPDAPEVVQVSQRVDPYGGQNVSPERDDEKHLRIGQMHLAIVKAAFRCDLTRTVTFQWSPGTNHVSFGGMWPPDEAIFKVHHTTSHNPNTSEIREFLTRIEVWYADKISAFLQELAATEDIGGGSLLDTTVVPYITEVSEGHSHSWNNMPWLLFGGAETGLRGGQYWAHSGGKTSQATGQNLRSTNDYWMACGKPFGLEDFVVGDDPTMYAAAIPGIFDDV
jgi:hypothetical protein